MANRFCEICGRKSSPFIPRQRLGDSLVCPPCAANHGRATVPHPQSRYTASLLDGRVAIVLRQGNGRIRRLAHDSGDGETIFHCPFCGSGQVIARNDGSTECEFCTTAFTVQVQPQMPAFPQTIDGVPVDVPGMPAGGAGANVPPGAAPGGDPADPEAGLPPGADPEADGEESEDDGGDDKPAFLKGSMLLRTAAGKRLNVEQYMRHLALAHTSNPERVLAQIRHENGDPR